MAKRALDSTKLERLYHEATTEERQNGLEWYTKAHGEAKKLSERYGIQLPQAAGIISALSPMNKWERNIKDAYSVCEHGERAVVSTFKANKIKALSILNGEPVEFTAPKTYNFFANIVDPFNNEYVTIDRHAIRACLRGGDHLIKDKQTSGLAVSKSLYYRASLLYRSLAFKHDVIPNQAQAIVWNVVKRKLANNEQL